MARNERFHDAERLSLPVPDGTGSGVAVIVGSLVGVTQTKEGEGGNADNFATVWMKGAFDLPVTGAVTQIGSPVYIPPAGGAVTTTATSNTLFGYALATKGSGVGTIPVKIAQV
jgi:predicted RecA/RadA family phage recombinase